jgi:NAD kinase
MISNRKMVVVTRKTRLEELKQKYCTLGQAKFYLEHLGESFTDYEEENHLYTNVINIAVDYLKTISRVQLLERSVLSTYLFSPDDIVIVIGQDGLVANTLKYLNGQPVIAINPMPSVYEGKLLPFLIGELKDIVLQTLSGVVTTDNISMAEVNTNLGQTLLAVNDIFIGPKTHSSARYTLSINEQHEEQSSSGVIISTGLGSTGWFKSILAGARGIAKQPIQNELTEGFPWASPYLYYSVREPFPSIKTGCELVFGQISNQSCFSMASKMPENGVIFSDGIEQDAIEFNAGVVAYISMSSRVGHLIRKE